MFASCVLIEPFIWNWICLKNLFALLFELLHFNYSNLLSAAFYTVVADVLKMGDLV